jgi:hypothetical protein
MLQKPDVHIRVPNLQVGHALENDLAALRVLHSSCIDTAALFPHPKVLTVFVPVFWMYVPCRIMDNVYQRSASQLLCHAPWRATT